MKPFSALVSGEYKTGKTHSLLTVFESERVKPERILYVDNHESTRAHPHISRYDKADKNPWGIWEVDFTMTEEVDKKVDQICSLARAGKAPYDVICWDDMTELEFTTFTKEESHFTGRDKRQLWGEHLDRMCQRQRRLAHRSGATLLATCRVGAMDDFTKPGVRDTETKQLVRPQIIRPLLRGKFGEWVSYSYDALIWARMKDGDKVVGLWDFKPQGAIRCGHRWMYDPTWPKVMENPSFDKLATLIEKAETYQLNKGG